MKIKFLEAGVASEDYLSSFEIVEGRCVAMAFGPVDEAYVFDVGRDRDAMSAIGAEVATPDPADEIMIVGMELMRVEA